MGNRCEQNSDKKEKWSPRTSTASSHLWFANCSLWYYPSNWTYFPALHLRPLSPSSGNIPVLISWLILTLSSFAQLQLLLLLVHSQDPPHLPGLPPPPLPVACPPHAASRCNALLIPPSLSSPFSQVTWCHLPCPWAGLFTQPGKMQNITNIKLLYWASEAICYCMWVFRCSITKAIFRYLKRTFDSEAQQQSVTHKGMVRLQQALEKLGYLWRLLNVGLGTYENLNLLKTSNYSKNSQTNPLFDHYSITPAFLGCDIFHKRDFSPVYFSL